jgi:YidC/Oxa1 family membrane protein insertase
MEKRVFLAIFLSFIVLALYQSMFAPSPVAPTAPAPPPQAASTPPADVGAIATPPHAGPAEDSAPQFPAVSVLVGETAVQDVVIETASVIAVFSNQGATLKSWRLRHYQGDDGQPIDLVPNALELLSPDACGRSLANVMCAPRAAPGKLRVILRRQAATYEPQSCAA